VALLPNYGELLSATIPTMGESDGEKEGFWIPARSGYAVEGLAEWS
jgi:hypothetical protein